MPVEDPDSAHPVAIAWRPVFREIVRAFVRGDFRLAGGIEAVEPVPADVAMQIERYLADYGATLIELPDDTWRTSCAQWLGHGWDVLVDLWTEDEGRSDLVLHAFVFESDAGYRFTVRLVYVP